MLNKNHLIIAVTLACSAFAQADIIETTRLHTFGQPNYPENFTHFNYVNPKAPKGGTVTYAATGTYDNFNRYSQRGNYGANIGQLYDGLMFSPSDEVNTSYGLIAEKIRYSDDFSWLEVDIHPKAVFHDGKKITAHDVAFTFDKFMAQGVPQYKIYYKDVASVSALNDQTARITMKTPNKDVLFSLVQGMSVLPKHFWQDKNLAEPLNTPPVGSGAYQISDYQLGQSITYTRVENYWAENHPVNLGRNNFNTIHYDYYRDDTVQLEAFKAGEFDLRQEGVAKFWATSYTGPNFDRGYIITENIPNETPQRMQGFIFNTEKKHLNNVRVREALTYLLDFEWMNRNLFYGQYKRTRSYFQNSDYEARGLPSSSEIAILEPIKDQIPERVFTEEYQPPVTTGNGRIRAQLRTALSLLKQAGWELKDGILIHTETQEPFTLELLAHSPTTERVATPYQQNLKRAGIELKIRLVDTSQYLKRWHERDYDVVFSSYSANAYPSLILVQQWHSEYLNSTYNQAGVTNKALDYLIEQIQQSQDDPGKLKALGPALDRVLQWNFYAVPLWHANSYRVASWDKFARPKTMPKYDLGIDTWWIDTEKAAKLPEKRR